MNPALSQIDGIKIMEALGVYPQFKERITSAKLNIFDGSPIITLDVSILLREEDASLVAEALASYTLVRRS